MKLKLCCISDEHEKQDKIVVPDGDVLIHAGDETFEGKIPAFAKFVNWMKQQPHKHKIFVAGNHSLNFQNRDRHFSINLLREAGITYLEDSWTEIEGLLFYGSPFSVSFYDWAFGLPKGKATAEKWSHIPDATNVLITHGPPYMIGDYAPRGNGY